MPRRENAEYDRRIMVTIDQVMRQRNPYARMYHNLHEAANSEEDRARRLGIQPKAYELQFVRHSRDDQRCYNAPTTSADCMYMIETGSGEVQNIDLAVHPKGMRGCQRINPNSGHVDPMVFPLLFALVESGWYINVKNALPQRIDLSLTPADFYASGIATRKDQFNQLHHTGKLFQQYIVHAYCTVECQRLDYMHHNQEQLRVECYQGLIDYVAEQAQERQLRAGNVFILPKGLIGGP